jgi:hypothetical protein
LHFVPRRDRIIKWRGLLRNAELEVPHKRVEQSAQTRTFAGRRPSREVSPHMITFFLEREADDVTFQMEPECRTAAPLLPGIGAAELEETTDGVCIHVNGSLAKSPLGK